MSRVAETYGGQVRTSSLEPHNGSRISFEERNDERVPCRIHAERYKEDQAHRSPDLTCRYPNVCENLNKSFHVLAPTTFSLCQTPANATRYPKTMFFRVTEGHVTLRKYLTYCACEDADRNITKVTAPNCPYIKISTG